MGKLQLLRMTAYDEQFSSAKGKPYVVMLNPETIKWNRKIDYSLKQAPGTLAPSQKFDSIPPEELSFDIVIDCTGVVDSNRIEMATEIESLEKVIFDYDGGIHRPNFVQINWGTLIFKSVLKTFDTTYTLFKPNGSPLRAKISLSFGEYISPSKVAEEEGDESPDMTHLVTVVEGDTLPQLCKKVWEDNSQYIHVARFNDLNKFRRLKGGKQLVFPPLIQPS